MKRWISSFRCRWTCLCIADVQGRFTRVNPAWEEVLGWTPEDLTASPYLDLVHPDDVAATARESAKLADGGVTVNFENRYRSKDGTYRWFSWKAAGNHERGLVYAVARDVTDEKRAARELQQYAAELSRRESRARGLQLFGVARPPGAAAERRWIQSGVARRLRRPSGPGRSGHLHRIRDAAQHMGQLIDDLLKLARVTRADLHLETDRFERHGRGHARWRSPRRIKTAPSTGACSPGCRPQGMPGCFRLP